MYNNLPVGCEWGNQRLVALNLTGRQEDVGMTANFKLLRARLESEQKRLTDELEQLMAGAHSADDRREGSPFGKREEEATEALELEKRLALEKDIRDKLVEIEHTLAKFDEGTYGKCDSCGESIEPARLDALPQANLCLSCKTSQAKNARGK